MTSQGNHRRKAREKSFTLIEILIVVAIIGVLASIVAVSTLRARDRAYFTRSQKEMRSMVEALNLYFLDNNYEYPCDVFRDLPMGLEQYLSSSPTWPKAPWPGSVYDYDFLAQNPSSMPDPDNPGQNCPGMLSYDPRSEPVYQISVRFCAVGDPSSCKFPKEAWASDFLINSSVYYCLEGPCRAHGSEPYNYPSCCIGGACPSGARLCK